ncbi:MAG: hypothetical protein AOA66_0571 [Candidatus Bathyarchaeota archaeon BA2]|nr:MAG: hypothetical protein AOA66_0571 [Candidatus Bathyarchaeota archaeon BA2]
MTVGVIIVIGGLQYFIGRVPREAMFLGVLLSSFYLLCLGIGSSLIQGHLGLPLWLIIAGSVLAMAGTAVYVAPSTRFKVAGSLIGIPGGVLLAIAIYNSEILDIVFDAQTPPWNVPFPGPFMSIAILEGFALIGVL